MDFVWISCPHFSHSVLSVCAVSLPRQHGTPCNHFTTLASSFLHDFFLGTSYQARYKENWYNYHFIISSSSLGYCVGVSSGIPY